MLKLGRAGRYRRLGVIAQMAIAITTRSAAMECIAGARLMTMTAISHTCRPPRGPPFLICAWRILCSKPRREWTRQRRPAVAGRSDRVPAKGKPKAVLLRALRGAATPVSGSRDGVPGDGVRADRSARPPGALPAGRAGVGQASACSSNASMMRFAAPLTCWAVCLMLSASMWLHPAT